MFIKLSLIVIGNIHTSIVDIDIDQNRCTPPHLMAIKPPCKTTANRLGVFPPVTRQHPGE